MNTTYTADNDNLQSTPDRVRNALRDDAVQAAQAYTSLPLEQQSVNALAKARKKAQPYFDFLAVAELLRPADIYVNDAMPVSDNDNTGYAVEYRHDIRPSEEEMLQAYADGMRSFVRRSPKGKIERFEGGVSYHAADEAVTVGGRSSARRFYGLHFHRGALVYFGQNGRRERVVDEQSEPRGPDAANDNYEINRETTTLPGAPLALEELERARRAGAVLTAMDENAARLIGVILQADTFAEVAEAAGLAPTSHNGRRVAIKMLAEAKNLIAA